MNCLLCEKEASGSFIGEKKEYPYCEKHKAEISIGINMLEDDKKAIERLQKKYKGKKK
jgi:hypothetical protein